MFWLLINTIIGNVVCIASIRVSPHRPANTTRMSLSVIMQSIHMELWFHELLLLNLSQTICGPQLLHIHNNPVLISTNNLYTLDSYCSTISHQSHIKMAAPPIRERTPIKDLQKVFHYTDTMTRKPTRDNDPYEYTAGFGNRHQSEVIPGTLPAGQNNPQAPRFGLYTEGITYSAFTAPRHSNFSTYMYRVRPAAAHSMS